MDWMGGSVTLADSRQWQTEKKTYTEKYKNIEFIQEIYKIESFTKKYKNLKTCTRR